MLHSSITFIESHARKLLAGLIFFILVAGGIYSYFQGDYFRFYDEGEYYIIAKNLVKTGIYTINGSDPTAWRPPGYPLFLALFLQLGGSIFTLRFIDFVLLAFTTFFVYRILERQSRLAAFLGACLMLYYPLFFFTAATLYPQTLSMALFIWTLDLIHQEKKLSYLSSGLIGAAYGFLTLTVVTFIGSLLTTICWIYLVQKGGWKKGILMLLTAIIVIAPWTIRNYQVFNRFVFIATNGGVAFVLGNSPETEPNLGGTISLPQIEKKKMNEIQIDQYYKARAMDYILNNKVESAKMYALKFLNHFNFSNVLMTTNQMSIARDAILFLTYYSLLGLAALGLIYSPKRGFNYYLLGLYLLNAAVMALFITRIRYRLPYDPILIILGAPFLASWLKKFHHRNTET